MHNLKPALTQAGLARKENRTVSPGQSLYIQFCLGPSVKPRVPGTSAMRVSSRGGSGGRAAAVAQRCSVCVFLTAFNAVTFAFRQSLMRREHQPVPLSAGDAGFWLETLQLLGGPVLCQTRRCVLAGP